ncbi:MAG TPA: ABC transporter permease [Vicinamibacterales bacterium]|nr:ABC transporter permease [Vicinamibacterales bacterium]
MSRLVSMWRNIVHRGRVEQDLDAEVRAAFELLVDEKTRAGLSDTDARRAAAIELRIEPIKEQVREVRAGAFFETMLQDVQYAARLLRRNPLFALTAALSLAIGIGATTTVFTVANGLLLSVPAGVSEPDRLVEIARVEEGDFGFEPIMYPDYLDIRQRATSVQGVYGYALNLDALSLRGEDGSERVFGSFVTMNFFDVLGVQAAAGRLFGRGDSERPGDSPVVVLSHAFWTRRFNRDQSLIGRTLTFNGQPMVVTGVAAEGFKGMSVLAPDVWAPAVMIPALNPESHLDFSPANRRIAWQMMMGARLAPGASRQQASAEVETIGGLLEREHAATKETLSALGIPLPAGRMIWRAAPASPIPSGMRLPVAGFLALLMALVSVVLVIACANLAGVLLARATVRRREIAVRTAIGAARKRLVRQLLTEAMLLFVLGGAVGLLLARAMTSLLVSLLPAFPLPVNLSVPLDGRVVAFSLGLSLVAAVLSGLAPALQASKADVVSALKDDSQGPCDRLRLRSAFVVAQVAFSILLVVTAGLLVRAFDRVVSVDPGYDSRGVDVATVDLSMAGYTSSTGPVFARQLLERVRALPGVESATLASRTPGPGGMSFGGLTVPGLSPPQGQPYFFANWTIVDSGYFATLRIPLTAGRDFTSDDRAGAQLVAIVGEAAARRLWPGKDAVGQTLLVHGPTVDGSPKPPTPLTVVGVARDVRLDAFRGVAPLALYVPLQQRYLPGMTLLVRRPVDGRLVEEMRKVVTAMSPNLAVLSAGTLESQQNGPVETQLRIAAAVAGSVGIVGLLLAAIGIYGVTAYAVTRRTREIGIRLSLGAGRTDVVAMVLRQAMTLVAVGSAIGLLLGVGAGVVLSGQRFGVPPPDATMFIGAAVLFAIVGLIAASVPVIRATRIRATEALRYE